MSFYAKIENNIVVNIVNADSEWIALQDGIWREYTENTPAGIGWEWNKEKSRAIPPKPFASWSLNSDTYLWEAPTPMPTDGKRYTWDEATTAWVEAPTL